jgi:hypothetical protein
MFDFRIRYRALKNLDTNDFSGGGKKKDLLILREKLVVTFQITQTTYTNVKNWMLYNTLNIVNSRYNPFQRLDTTKYLTPGEQTKFSNDFRTRVQNTHVSWNGGLSFAPF